MKLLVFLCLSQFLLCSLVCGDHGGPHEDEDHHEHHHVGKLDFLHNIAPANLKSAYKIYDHLAQAYPNDNLFFCPLSISIAFSLLSLGAKGKTLSEIHNVLGFDEPPLAEETIHKGFQQLLHIINQPKSDLQLNSANALFIDKGAKLQDKFLEGAKTWYHSEAISTDFKETQEAVKKINSYVEKKTNEKIKNLLDDLDPMTILVIVNTIFFKGSWEHSFNVNHTREEDFHVDEKTVVKVPMMTRRGKYLVAELEDVGCTVVDVPYKGNTSAIFILPKLGKLHEVEKALQNVTLQTVVDRMTLREIFLSVPKFSVSADLDLVKEFQLLGMSEVFSHRADLSGIAEGDNLKVSKAVHSAQMTMDEEGTEAAAATAVGVTKLSLPMSIKVNRPYSLIIFKKDISTVAFAGRIMNPKK